MENLEEFVNDFPLADQPAPKKQLTTSWRNPAGVLSMANVVSEKVFFPEGRGGRERPVAELSPREGVGQGVIDLAYFDTREQEVDHIAELMESEYHAAQEIGRGFTGAVLVRKNADSPAIAEALTARGIPHEIVGLGGLLMMPEVADLVAIATLLVRPGNSEAALRILSGPLVGLGLADLTALQKRARNLSGRRERVELPEEPTDRLRAQLSEITAEPPEQKAGLGDAIADPGEAERYSAEGWRRLRLLSTRLHRLRSYSLRKSLPDLVADIEEAFDLRTEVLARPDASRRGGAVHLDQFAHIVAGFHGDTLPVLLDYLELAREQEDGLEPGEVTVREDRVQILTIHKAKGLEWDVVAVAHVDDTTYKPKTYTYLTNACLLPDAMASERYAEAGDRKDFEKGENDYKNAQKEREKDEAGRLFYVAITRTERVLSISASKKKPFASGDRKPYEHFETLHKEYPQFVTTWAADTADGASSDAPAAVTDPAPQEKQFPDLTVSDAVRDGAIRVSNAHRTALPPVSRGELFELWEREVDALIEEHKALSAPTVTVELPADLTATDLVAIKSDPVAFARRQRRPVPFKPNTYAKRGTAFHQWLEDRFGVRPLLDEDELPGNDEAQDADAHFEELKEKFLASEWAERTPHRVEAPFEVAIGQAMVRGRVDAVFRRDDGSWLIVDWKTGRVPTGKDLADAEIQLAVYREAWRRKITDGARIDAAFYYVMTGTTLAPRDLPDGEALKLLLSSAATALDG